MKLCKDCNNYWYESIHKKHYCRLLAGVDVVTGGQKFETKGCYDRRKPGGECGLDAEKFEEKTLADACLAMGGFRGTNNLGASNETSNE